MAELIPTPFPPNWQCVKVLPTVYDDSLSYYEVLGKITLKVNEVIETLQSWKTDNQAYTEAQAANLRSEILAQIDEINAELLAIKNALQEQKQYIDTQDNAILQKLNETNSALLSEMIERDAKVLSELYAIIKTTDEINRDWTIQKLEELKKLINEVNEDGFTIFNPLKGYKTKVGIAVNNVYEALRYYGVTATEYDNLQLTAEQYEAKNILALVYDTDAKHEFPKYFFYLFSPFSGELVSHQTAINEIAQSLSNGLTADKYSVILITAKGYDDLQLTAYAYDWNGKTLVHK